MLSHLLTTYGHIKSWNLFESDKGYINVNIRFNNVVNETGMGGHVSVQPVSYRRQSSQQIARNKHRADTFKSKHVHRDNTISATDSKEEYHMDSKKRKIANTSPENPRRDIEDTITFHNIDTPVTMKAVENEEVLSPVLFHITTPHTPYGPQSESVILTEYEHTEKTQPLQTFVANETHVDPVEYGIAISTPEPMKCDSFQMCILKPKPLLVDKPQLKIDTHAKTPQFCKPKSLSLSKVILCPCCNVEMTPNHECLNTSLSELSHEYTLSTHSDHSPEPPPEAELCGHPPDDNTAYPGLTKLLDNHEFYQKCDDHCKTQ